MSKLSFYDETILTSVVKGKVNSFDLVADRFERYRRLPSHVPVAIRQSLHVHAGIDSKARLLEVGCGTGRLGGHFSNAGDNYLGLDLSMKMLREFCGKKFVRRPNVIQADGCFLPFGDRIFAAVLMMHLPAIDNWHILLMEAQRVLEAGGVLVTGKIQSPSNGFDATMRTRLAALLAGMGVTQPLREHRTVDEWLRARSCWYMQVTPVRWNVDRSPREFLLRKKSAARFASLPAGVREAALRSLQDWAEQSIGPLDTPLSETHSFCLELHWF